MTTSLDPSIACSRKEGIVGGRPVRFYTRLYTGLRRLVIVQLATLVSRGLISGGGNGPITHDTGEENCHVSPSACDAHSTVSCSGVSANRIGWKILGDIILASVLSQRATSN